MQIHLTSEKYSCALKYLWKSNSFHYDKKKVKKTNTFQRSRILETHFSDMHPDITRQDVTFSYTPYCFFIISDHYNVTLGKCQKNLPKSKLYWWRWYWLALTYHLSWQHWIHSVEKGKIHFHAQNILAISLVKTLLFMKYLSKKCESKFP